MSCNISTPSSGNLTIYEDGVVLNSTVGSSVVYNKTYSVGSDYNITCSLLDHQNYSTASDQSWVNATDQINPNVTLVSPGVGYWNDSSDPFAQPDSKKFPC